MIYFQGTREGVEQNECDYFDWYDEEMCEKGKEVINELKVERKVLLQENYALKRRLETICNGDMWNEVDGIMKELRQLK